MSNNLASSKCADNEVESTSIVKHETVDIPPCSVLRSDQIERLVRDHKQLIIDHYEEEQVRAASYDVRLGPEYYQDGKIQTLSKEDDRTRWLRIKPLDMVYVSSWERFHLPQDVIGRYSLRLGLMYEGLVLAGGGAQVDPGYRGNLFGLLINFSSEEIILEIEDHWATIEFSPTTYETGLSKLYQDQPQNYQDCTSIRDLFPKPVEVEAGKRRPVTSAMIRFQAELQRTRGEFVTLQSNYQSAFAERTTNIRQEFEEAFDKYRQDTEKRIKEQIRELESRINIYTFGLLGILTLTLIALVILVVLK